MAFREVIEAILRAKDVNRFKGGMERAAKSVRKFGRDTEQAEVQTELLEQILERITRQSIETAAALRALATSVDEVGDEMVQTAAKSTVMNAVMKKSGSNAVFLGKSWAFWKDRLSLTRSEILTTAITMSVYFSPAIIAMGSSFAFAALGGGGVAFGGLSSFIFGMVTLNSLLGPMIDNLDKITKAQDQLNLAIAQYGAGSEQASRANAHLFGVIQTEGGPAMGRLAASIAKLKKDWIDLTTQSGPGARGGRGNILDILQGGVRTARALMPTFATGANQISLSLRTAMRGFFKEMRGNEMRATFRSMFQTFDKAIGPGIKGFTNVIVVMGRIIRATAPFVVEWAKAWQSTTASWRRGTKDSTKLSRFFEKAVTHFKAWWGLAKELGRTFRIIFGATRDEGLDTVLWLTKIVRGFNDWLQLMSDTGAIDRWFAKWHRSLDQIVHFIQHPLDSMEQAMPRIMAAIDKWLPIILTHIANSFASAGPVVAQTFAKAFINAGAWAKFFTLAIFLKKFGFFSFLGGRVAENFLRPFAKAFSEGFAARITGAAAAEGVIGQASTAAGTKAGTVFGAAFVAAAIIGVALIGEAARREIDKAIREKIPGGNILSDVAGFLNQNLPGPLGKANKLRQEVFDTLFNKETPQRDKDKAIQDIIRRQGKAIGGTVPFGGGAVVGESGPEVLNMTPMGAQITPLSGFSPVVDLPNIQNSLRISLNSTIQVNRREIARAVAEEAAYVAARRGGRPQQ